MKARIITAVLWGAIVGLITYIGGTLFDVLYLGITFIAIYEITKLMQNDKKFPYEAVVNYGFAVGLFLIEFFKSPEAIIIVILIYTSANFIFFVTMGKVTLVRLSQSFFVGFYVVLFMYHMVMINDTAYVWLIYIIAFSTDTFAYFVGVFFGKHKLCPHVSPNKTVEGAIGGIVGCVATTLTYCYFINLRNYLFLVIFIVFTSIFSMVGDLLASKIKREYGVKDYGNFLPGHGGILDRFDSVLFVAPVVYYFAYYFIEYFR